METLKGDSDHLTLVTKWLNTAEGQLVKVQQNLISAEETLLIKDAQISSLTEKISTLQDQLNYETTKQIYHSSVDAMPYEVDKCRLLEKQVLAMESFFRDYGLEWVGDDNCLDETMSEDTEEWYVDKSVVSNDVDFNRLLQNIEELNMIAEEETHMYYTTKGAVFKRTESIPLLLYANGLSLPPGPFRQYSDPATRLFLQDILDGYYPSELQQSYPDGVPFQVTDNRNILYQDPRMKWKAFNGKGYRLGGRTSNVQLIESTVESHENGNVLNSSDNDNSIQVYANQTKSLPYIFNNMDGNLIDNIQNINPVSFLPQSNHGTDLPILRNNEPQGTLTSETGLEVPCEAVAKSSEMTYSSVLGDLPQEYSVSLESKGTSLVSPSSHAQVPFEEAVKKNNESKLKITPELTKTEEDLMFIRNNFNLTLDKDKEMCDSSCMKTLEPSTFHLLFSQSSNHCPFQKGKILLSPNGTYSMYYGLPCSINNHNASTTEPSFTCCQDIHKSEVLMSKKFDKFSDPKYPDFVLPQIQRLSEHKSVNEMNSSFSEPYQTAKKLNEKSNSVTNSLQKNFEIQTVDKLSVEVFVSSNHNTNCVLKDQESTPISNKIMKNHLPNLIHDVSTSRQNIVSQTASLIERRKMIHVNDFGTKENLKNITSNFNIQHIRKISDQNNIICDEFKTHTRCPDPRIRAINGHLEDELFPKVDNKIINTCSSFQELNNIKKTNHLMKNTSSTETIRNENDKSYSGHLDSQQIFTKSIEKSTGSISIKGLVTDNKDGSLKKPKSKLLGITEVEKSTHNFSFNYLLVGISSNQLLCSNSYDKFVPQNIHYMKPLESYSEVRRSINGASHKQAELCDVKNGVLASILTYSKLTNPSDQNKTEISSKPNEVITNCVTALLTLSEHTFESDKYNINSDNLQSINPTVSNLKTLQESSPIPNFATLKQSNNKTYSHQSPDSEFEINQKQLKLHPLNKVRDNMNKRHNSECMKRNKSTARSGISSSHSHHTANLKSKMCVTLPKTPVNICLSNSKQRQKSIEGFKGHNIHTLSLQKTETEHPGFLKKEFISSTSHVQLKSKMSKIVQKHSQYCSPNSDIDLYFNHDQKNFWPIQSRTTLPMFNKNEINHLQRQIGPNAVTPKELLNKLPPVVIQNEKVVPGKKAAAEMIQVSAVITPITQILISESVRQKRANIKITLKVRLWHGNKVYLVHISPDDSVETLRQLLDQIIPPLGRCRPGYHIISRHAAGRPVFLKNASFLLKDYGLVHNTVIYLQKRK